MQKNSIPCAITSLRLVALPFLLFFLYADHTAFFFALFLFLLLTDIVDGYLARKINATSRAGAYYDTIADFCVIIGVFLVFVIKGVTPYWVPAIIIVSYVLFMMTSLLRTQMYDPIGKYFGGFLYVTIAVLALAPTYTTLVSQVIVIFFVASLVSRIAYLFFLR